MRPRFLSFFSINKIKVLKSLARLKIRYKLQKEWTGLVGSEYLPIECFIASYFRFHFWQQYLHCERLCDDYCFVCSQLHCGWRRNLKNSLTVFIISFLAIVISDLCFFFLHPFIALCISLFILLAAIKYVLIRDHDSGWFGALCIELIGLIFLMVFYTVLALAQFFLF